MRSGLALRLRVLLLVLLAGGSLVAGSCKKNDGPTCKPEEKKFKFRVLVQPGELINPDEQGESLATVVRIYQLKGDVALSTLDFRDAWQKGKDAFGDEFLTEEERTIYPGRPEMIELEPDPKAAFVVAVALFREPTGVGWYRTWEVPKYHADSVCLAEIHQKTLPDPCFYLLIDRSTLDGGHTPPPGFDASKTGVQCPGPPAQVKPPMPESKKEKKKKKRDLKKLKKLEKAKDAKAPEAKAPEAPKAPEEPKAPEAPGG